MPIISERDVSVFISLLSMKICEMTAELGVAVAATGEPSAKQIDEQVALQETLAQYEQIRDTMREEYEEGLKRGINLPSYESLTRPPDS